MKTQILNKMIATVAICGIGFLSASAIAGPDFFQQQMTQSVLPVSYTHLTLPTNREV